MVGNVWGTEPLGTWKTRTEQDKSQWARHSYNLVSRNIGIPNVPEEEGSRSTKD